MVLKNTLHQHTQARLKYFKSVKMDYRSSPAITLKEVMFNFIVPLESNADLFTDYFFATDTNSHLSQELEDTLLEDDLRLAS